MLGRRTQVESVQGTEVSVRAGAQWGQGWVPSATTTPRPLSWGRRRSTVEAWIHSSTFTTINIFTFGMETNEINFFFFIFNFWIPFLFSYTWSQGSLSISCAFPGLFSLWEKLNEMSSKFVGYRECPLFKSFSLKLKKLDTHPSVWLPLPSPCSEKTSTSTWWPPLQGPLWND